MSIKIVYITAGAAGMICGSCLHDNALVKAIARKEIDIQLVPFYTPIRTDEDDVSVDQVFFGGINVYLQQKMPMFRAIPRWIDRILDHPRLINRVTSRALETNAKMLGEMAISMLKGNKGHQRKEVQRVVQWLVHRAKPDVIIISNLLVAAFVTELKRHRQIPVVVTLQGDDVFLNSLTPSDRDICLQLIAQNNVSIDAFLTHSRSFKKSMNEYFSIPLERIFVTPLGIDTRDFRALPEIEAPAQRSIGYLARLAPEKGLHNLVDAFIELRRDQDFADVRLDIAGWLGPEYQSYANEQWSKLNHAGLTGEFHYAGVVARHEKLEFLQKLSLLSVPVTHEEPKGLFVLEALACGTPVVLPNRGAFPELVEASGGGLLFEADQLDDYLMSLKSMLVDPERRRSLGRAGRTFVLNQRNEQIMAEATLEVLRHELGLKI